MPGMLLKITEVSVVNNLGKLMLKEATKWQTSQKFIKEIQRKR